MSFSSADRLPIYFAFILYKEDIEKDFYFCLHGLSGYLDRFNIDYAYILHDSPDDLKSEVDDSKKEHFHVLVHCRKRIYCNAFFSGFSECPSALRFLRPTHPDIYALYLTHEDSSSKKAGKVVYPAESIICNNHEWLLSLRTVALDVEEFSVIDDIELFIAGTLSIREFLVRHPKFVYRATSLKALIELFRGAKLT